MKQEKRASKLAATALATAAALALTPAIALAVTVDRTDLAIPAPIEVMNAPCSTVVVDYTPPIEGDIAEFVARFEELGTDPIDEAQATYSWEMSYDDGATWTPLSPSETGKTLRVLTSTGQPNFATPLMLIRAVAVTPNHDPLVSDAVPFTIRAKPSVSDSTSKPIERTPELAIYDSSQPQDEDQKLSTCLGIEVKTKTLKAKTLKKRAHTIKAIKVKGAKGKKIYTLKKALKGKKDVTKRFKVNKKNGKIIVKKGTKKGIYRVKVKFKAAGNKTYAAQRETITVKILVK